jgi:hypothetical protein
MHKDKRHGQVEIKHVHYVIKYIGIDSESISDACFKFYLKQVMLHQSCTLIHTCGFFDRLPVECSGWQEVCLGIKSKLNLNIEEYQLEGEAGCGFRG